MTDTAAQSPKSHDPGEAIGEIERIANDDRYPDALKAAAIRTRIRQFRGERPPVIE